MHYDVRERRMQTKHQQGDAGSRLKLVNVREGTALHASLPAVSGKTRRKRRHHSKPGFAPRLYPTAGGREVTRVPTATGASLSDSSAVRR